MKPTEFTSTADAAQIAQNIATLRERMLTAAEQAQRSVDSVHLLAVSKQQPAAAIAAAHAAGIHTFGESYVQEALAKQEDMQTIGLSPAPSWHYIGHIQSNKTAKIAQHFSWVHSISRLAIAERLSRQRPQALPPLNVCIEINLDAQLSKKGVMMPEVMVLAAQIRTLPNLQLRGLMVLPRPRTSVAEQRAAFAQVRGLFEQMQAAGYAIDTLSMGMSQDFEAAIAEGATLIRVGTAIFGTR